LAGLSGGLRRPTVRRLQYFAEVRRSVLLPLIEVIMRELVALELPIQGEIAMGYKGFVAGVR